MLIEPRNFSALLGTLRGISDRALSSHLAIYRQAVDRLNAIEQAFPLVEWKAAGSPDAGDAITSAILAAPVAKLDLRPVGPLAECLAQVEADLEARGIAFRPAWYLGVADDDFWTVDRAISVNIPWCFANPSLWRLANRSRFTAYTPDQMLRTLRHEAGHALLYGFELWRRPDWQNVFGDSRQPYVERYEPVEGSRDFVEYTTYVRAHYGQKHPDEDWAESFACWLDPVTNWRQQYQDWPLALWKLEYVDALARGGQFAGATPNPYLGKRAPYQQTRGTVAETLGVGTSAPSTGLHGTWSEHASLLEAEPAAYNDVLLHEAHFGALVGGSSSPPESLVAAVAANWGSWDSYLLDLRLACAASRGWVLTLWDERRGQVRNALVQPGGAVPVGCQVLLALDCETHAYALDFGAAKHLGVAAEFENINWEVVAELLPAPVFTITQDFEEVWVDPSVMILPATADEAEPDDEHRNAGREGLIPVDREVHRGQETHHQIFWVRPDEKQEGDRELSHEEAAKHDLEQASSTTGTITSEMSHVAKEKLEAREAATVDKKTESALIVDKHGNVVLDKKGSKHHVVFRGEELRMMKDCHFTHNHPGGGPLSPSDLNLAVECNMASIRAVARDPVDGKPTVYSFNRPSGGWQHLTKFNANIVETDLRAELDDRVNLEHTLTRDQANQMFGHELWKRVQAGPAPGKALHEWHKPIDVGYRVEKRQG